MNSYNPSRSHVHGATPQATPRAVDPNEWLVQTARDEPDVEQLVTDKRARFLHVDTFDASSLGVTFDYVLSHSVLSHCAH